MRDGLITLIFVDWLPPCTDTSRGFLALGAEIGPLRERSITFPRIPRPTAAAPRCLSGLGNALAVAPPFFPIDRLAVQAGTGPWARAMAQMKPTSSRAMATTILLCGSFLAASLRKRAHRRTCAAQAIARTGAETLPRRRCRIGATRAG